MSTSTDARLSTFATTPPRRRPTSLEDATEEDAGIIAGITDVTIARARASSSADGGHHARDRHRVRPRARAQGGWVTIRFRES
jgi:hypothetical protein|tara:strand:- start:29752 stop:30000 length:249 start_codon:yes stop_codon:yes gene_type:complete